jgi:hypothetical protein
LSPYCTDLINKQWVASALDTLLPDFLFVGLLYNLYSILADSTPNFDSFDGLSVQYSAICRCHPAVCTNCPSKKKTSLCFPIKKANFCSCKLKILCFYAMLTSVVSKKPLYNAWTINNVFLHHLTSSLGIVRSWDLLFLTIYLILLAKVSSAEKMLINIPTFQHSQ